MHRGASALTKSAIWLKKKKAKTTVKKAMLGPTLVFREFSGKGNGGRTVFYVFH